MGGSRERPLSGGATRLPLWTDRPGAGLAKGKEENLWEQTSPSASPTSCQISWANSLTSLSLSFLICQTGIMPIFPSPLAKCHVRGKCSVGSQHIVVFTCPHLVKPSHLPKRANHTGRHTSWTPIHTLPSRCPFN